MAENLQLIFSQWGFDLKFCRPDLHIAGSPDRAVKREVLESTAGELFVIAAAGVEGQGRGARAEIGAELVVPEGALFLGRGQVEAGKAHPPEGFQGAGAGQGLHGRGLAPQGVGIDLQPAGGGIQQQGQAVIAAAVAVGLAAMCLLSALCRRLP